MENYVLMINNKEYKTLCKFNVRHSVKKNTVQSHYLSMTF